MADVTAAKANGDKADGANGASAGPRRSGLVQERSRRTRQELVNAALKLWTERGFETGIEETTVEEIARAAGVTKGTFYFHFAHKEDILLEVGWSTSEAMAKTANRIIDSGKPVEEALDEVLTALARRITSVPRAVVAKSLLEYYRRRDMPVGDENDRLGFGRSFALVLESARDRGEIPADADVELLASMLLWLVLGCIDFWNCGNKFDLAEAMRVRGRFVLAGARNTTSA
ncbi:MAG: TetR family transcriptional regulator [Acidimicrobiia bacterium]